MRLASVLLAIALIALAPAVASAATNAPPGNSGISQYLEVVPSSSGSKPSGRDPNKPSPLSKKTQKALAGSQDGETLARVINNTAPESSTPAAKPAKSKSAKKKSKAAKSKLAVESTNTTETRNAEAVAMAYKGGSGGGGGSGIGVPLIALMAGAAAVVGAFALARRKGGAGPEAEPEL